jgi:hypothetical protein
VVTVEITPLESGGQSVLLSGELMSLPPGKHSLYLAPTPQGDSGRDALLREAREALILARSALGHPDNIAAVQATLAKLDAALPPDLGTA